LRTTGEQEDDVLISGQRFFDSRTLPAPPEDLEVTRVPDGEEAAFAADDDDTYVEAPPSPVSVVPGLIPRRC